MSTNVVNKEVVYSDFTNNFDAHPVKKDLVRVLNEASAKRAIRNLLLIDKEERFFKPDVGSNIRASLFEPLTPFTAETLRSEVEEVIRNFEPRVQLVDVSVKPVYDMNAYSVTIVFYILNKADPVNYNVTLERIR